MNLSFSSFKELLSFLDSLFDSAHIKEGLFRQIVEFTVKNHVEALDGIFY